MHWQTMPTSTAVKSPLGEVDRALKDRSAAVTVGDEAPSGGSTAAARRSSPSVFRFDTPHSLTAPRLHSPHTDNVRRPIGFIVMRSFHFFSVIS